MNLNYRKLTQLIILMFLGFVIVIYGVLSIFFDKNEHQMSDDEIIIKAKELGLVELSEAYAKWQSEYKTQIESELRKQIEEELKSSSTENQ